MGINWQFAGTINRIERTWYNSTQKISPTFTPTMFQGLVCFVWGKVTLMDDKPMVRGLLSWSSCFLPRRSKYSMCRKFLWSICLALRRNSAETKDSIFFRSSRDFKRAARRNPLYRLSTCFCNPESLGPPEGAIVPSSVCH